jgi:hypothetical protein
MIAHRFGNGSWDILQYGPVSLSASVSRSSERGGSSIRGGGDTGSDVHSPPTSSGLTRRSEQGQISRSDLINSQPQSTAYDD